MRVTPREQLVFLLVEERGYSQEAARKMIGISKGRMSTLLSSAWRKFSEVRKSCQGVSEDKVRQQFLAV